MNHSIKKVVVTGGGGFIGTHTVALLRSFGIDAWAFDEKVGDSVLDRERVRTAVEWSDAVIHLAGILGTSELYDRAHEAVDVNIHGTLNVLEELARPVNQGKRLVLIDQPHIWYNIYEATHLAASRLALAFHKDFGVPVDFVCAYNAYGPGQAVESLTHPRKIVPTFATRAWSGQPILVSGSGNQVVDLVYVGDIANALVVTLLSGHGEGDTHHAGTGQPITVNEVAEFVRYIVKLHGGPVVPIVHTASRRGENVKTSWRDNVAPQPSPYRLQWPLLAATVDYYRSLAPEPVPAPSEP